MCLTFNGPPPNDGNIYVVNHKDGDKHNNHYSNLEWVIRSYNNIHALKTGLRDDNIPITVTDLVKNETKTYYSIVELCRQFNIRRELIYTLIGRHRKTPLHNRYLFNIDINKFGSVVRVNSVPLLIFDYVNNIWWEDKSFNMAAVITGLKQSTMKYLLSLDYSIEIAGYYISRNLQNRKNINIKYDAEKANEDRVKYFEEDKINLVFNNIVINEHN